MSRQPPHGANQREAVEIRHFQIGKQQVTVRLAKSDKAASPSETETTLRFRSLSCSATQRLTAALSSA